MAVIEICLDCDDRALLVHNLDKVYQAGAQRIELCGAMSDDGLTPDIDAVKLARRTFATRAGVLVMIRPRAGDFYYDADEIELMVAQIKSAATAGADGVVFAVLERDQSEQPCFNLSAMTRLVAVARSLKLQVSCHRGFDVLENRELALQQLIALGIDRVLTTGSLWGESCKAIDNIQSLRRIIQLSQKQIEVVIAGGITPAMAQEIAQQLSDLQGDISLHAFSGVLTSNKINSDAVQALVNLS
ncbi:copper homeostasis protein CutC [Alteromonadaceae bacterium BrNp21-10]|nr:copper homeostasis protein CutC [Alteromonadaceae bacterium BrNp21-10]